MFTALHALAKDATLLITAQAEGDQLRVSVTPTYPGGKAPAGVTPLRPLSVLGTPAEFDADFATALTIWRAPKKSLIEQAQAAADDDAEEAGTKPAAKVAAKAGKAESKGKPGRKPAAPPPGETSDADDKKKDDTGSEAAPPAGNSAEAPVEAAPADAPGSDSEPALSNVPPAVADVHTLDLF